MSWSCTEMSTGEEMCFGGSTTFLAHIVRDIAHCMHRNEPPNVTRSEPTHRIRLYSWPLNVLEYIRFQAFRTKKGLTFWITWSSRQLPDLGQTCGIILKPMSGNFYSGHAGTTWPYDGRMIFPQNRLHRVTAIDLGSSDSRVDGCTRQ
jgi:hypothetical protein